MNKKKITIISITAVILIGIVTYGLLYLFLYEKNNDEIVKFGNKLKVNIDDDFALVDISTGEIVENIHVVCNGKTKLMKEGVVKEALERGNINIKSSTMSTVNYQDCMVMFYEQGENYVFQITHMYADVSDEGLTPVTDRNVFLLYFDKDDFSKFIIRIGDSEKENDKYAIVRASDSKEAKAVLDKFVRR